MDSSGDPIEIIENSDGEKNTEKKSEEIVKEQEIIKNACENDNVEITSELTEAGKEPDNKNLIEPNVEDLEKEEDFQLLISDEEPAPQIIDENLVETIEPERLVPDEMGKKDENNFEEKRNLLMECGVLEIVDDKETSNMGENQQDIEMDQNIEESLPVEIVKSQEDLIVTDNTLCDVSLEKQNIMTIDENAIANDEEAAPNIVEQDECIEETDLKPSTKEEDISISVNVEKGEEKEICVEKEIEIDNSTIAVECLDEKLKNEEKNGDLITEEKIKEFTEMVSKDETNLIEEKDVNLDEKSVAVELAEVKDTKPENETENELDEENEKHTQDNVEIINKSDDNKKVPLEGIIIPSDDDDDEENNDVNARDNEKENNQINYGEEKEKYDDQKADDDQEDEYDTEDSESDDTDHDDSDDDDEEDDDEKEDNDNDNIKSKQIKIKKTSQNIYDDDVTEDEDEDDDVDDNDLEEEEEEAEEEEQEYNSAKKKPKIEKTEDDDDIMILSSDDDEKPPPQIEIKPSTSGISMKSQKPKHEENNINELNQWDEDDDMDSDDYDDDDLMNDVVMATAMRKVSAAGEIFHRKSRRIDGIKLSKQIRFKKKLKRSIRQIDYRSKVKNRSIKW
ncbi:glutamic acid-rich protein-like [Condylostylus longicornis]|uniref:glutamic acid-rich protein-like n=1 Tax=Condylostylus longicornis TaxID=2530218 RepID=UPI00244E3924|nr:glutamic acid-rich protein-like [Condylostylus longicornis]